MSSGSHSWSHSGRLAADILGDMESNPLLHKSYAFALKIVSVCRKLTSDRREYTLSRQLLKAGTSIGANAEEAIGGSSPRDFAAKVGISYKESRESHYWLRLLRDSDLLDEKEASGLIADCTELERITGSILRTMRGGGKRPPGP